jgi:hypothetical protein
MTFSIDTPQDYVYGVGALTENDSSSGVEWQDCVYLKHSGENVCTNVTCTI